MKELLEDPEFQKLLPLMPYIIAIGVIQLILLLLLGNTIRTTLLLVKRENRLMIPGQAFLIALPLFNIFWNFQVVRHLRDSLINEFYDRKIPVDENPTQKEGSIYAWSYLVRNFPLPSFILYVAMGFNIIGFVMYWRKVLEYKRLLKETIYTEEEEVVSF